MNVLVTGADGQLGRTLRRLASDSGRKEGIKFFFTDIDDLDVTSQRQVEDFIAGHDIDVTVNCAAYTNVERAEEDYDAAERLNAEAVGNLARAMKGRDGWLIHISTDYVFGGASVNTPISETEPVNPESVYGLTKLHGEQAVKESGCKALVIRTAWLYSEYGSNFVKTMLRLTGSQSSVKVVFDQTGTPTNAADLASAILEILALRKFEGNEGVYHFSGEGVCSWYDFAVEIASLAGNEGCEVVPCRSAEFPSKVRRPAYSVLDKSKFKDTFRIGIPHWRVSLKNTVKNLLSNEA